MGFVRTLRRGEFIHFGKKIPTTARDWHTKIQTDFKAYHSAFFLYASAMYSAQPLESLLEKIIEDLRQLGRINFVNKGWDWETVAQSKQTFGKLTTILEGYFAKHFPRSIKKFRKLFQKCVQDRNWLAHDFFAENFEDLRTGLSDATIIRIGLAINRFVEMARYLLELAKIIEEYKLVKNRGQHN